ncbi:MauE/DoxX family redox-associated membrane protein [Streptomyces sp. NPDC005065]|uniref:MauE/DoxX family redox-associated membrane protein n=1 Tax=unclassified Streptomyces TaxID=2593676 RepID=UPI0033B7000B
MELLLAMSRLSLVTLFGVSAMMKARDLTPLVNHISLTMKLRWRQARGLALATIAAELATTAALLTVPFLGFIASLALLGCFTVHLSSVLTSGMTTSCACAGSSESPVSAIHIVRNGILMTVAAAGVALASLSRPETLATDLVVAAPAALLGGGILWLDEIAGFFSPRYSRSS